MNNRINLVVIAILSLCSCGPSDSCREYSDFTCEQIEKADYNTYFYFPELKQNSELSLQEVYLGQAAGLSMCGSMARSYAYANERKLEGRDDWGYICCMIANGSSCYEKHR